MKNYNVIETNAERRGYELIASTIRDNGLTAPGTPCDNYYSDVCTGTAFVKNYDGATVCAPCLDKYLRECQTQWSTVGEYANLHNLVEFPDDMSHDEFRKIENKLGAWCLTGVSSALDVIANAGDVSTCPDCDAVTIYDDVNEWRHLVHDSECFLCRTNAPGVVFASLKNGGK